MCNNVECHGQDECLVFAAISSLLVTFCDPNLQTRVTVKSRFFFCCCCRGRCCRFLPGFLGFSRFLCWAKWVGWTYGQQQEVPNGC